MNKTTTMACALALALAACGKPQEVASEKAAEKMIESAISKDGSKAKVDLDAGQARITTTDAQGRTSQMEMGGAQVGEADLGIAFYPGAKPVEGQSSRVTTPDGSMLSIGLQSSDAPDKVAGFYRDAIKSQSAGKQMMEMSDGSGGATFMLADDATSSAVQVHVRKAEGGSEIQIVSTRGKGK